MKKMSLKLGIILAILLAGIYSCQDELGEKISLKNEGAELTNPQIIVGWNSGNAEFECGQVENCTEETFALKIDEWIGNMDDDYDYTGYNQDQNEIKNTIKITNSDDYTFDWESEMPVCKVIVVGGTAAPGTGQAANVYHYPDGAYSGQGLLAILNNNSPDPDDTFEISHVTFCFYEDGEDCDWYGETAWAANGETAGSLRYNTLRGGNWATYVQYLEVEKIVTLFAGQKLNAGLVTFSDPIEPDDNEIKITIILNPGWRFENTLENVKIMDYESAPSGNPTPGLFAHKGNADINENKFEIIVPINNFYGVHVEVEEERCE